MGRSSGCFSCFWFVSVLTWMQARKREFSWERGFEESQIWSLKVCLGGVRGIFKKEKERGTRRRRRRRMRNKVTLVERGLVHFCVRYAPMVRLAAPSAAIPKTVLMEGQEQLKTESLCLSYSSTKASWERHREKKERQLIGLLKNMCLPMCVFLRQLVIWWVESKENTTQAKTGISSDPGDAYLQKQATSILYYWYKRLGTVLFMKWTVQLLGTTVYSCRSIHILYSIQYLQQQDSYK